MGIAQLGDDINHVRFKTDGSMEVHASDNGQRAQWNSNPKGRLKVQFHVDGEQYVSGVFHKQCSVHRTPESIRFEYPFVRVEQHRRGIQFKPLVDNPTSARNFTYLAVNFAPGVCVAFQEDQVEITVNKEQDYASLKKGQDPLVFNLRDLYIDSKGPLEIRCTGHYWAHFDEAEFSKHEKGFMINNNLMKYRTDRPLEDRLHIVGDEEGMRVGLRRHLLNS